MKLTGAEALARLAGSDHGVFCTLHPKRGIDAVPVVFVVNDGFVGVPIDRVKPKSSFRLQRERNLEADPRATLLVEHWDADDWSKLWWVRAELLWQPDTAGRESQLDSTFKERYPQYQHHPDPFARVLVLRVLSISGWAS